MELANKKNKTVPQIILRWLVQQNVVVLVKSISKTRIQENFSIFDFELSKDEMDIINSLDRKDLIVDHTTLAGLEIIRDFCQKHKCD